MVRAGHIVSLDFSSLDSELVCFSWVPCVLFPALLWRSAFSLLCSTSFPFVHLPDCLHLLLICSLCYLSLVFPPHPCWFVCCLSTHVPDFVDFLPTCPTLCSLDFCSKFCSGFLESNKDFVCWSLLSLGLNLNTQGVQTEVRKYIYILKFFKNPPTIIPSSRM